MPDLSIFFGPGKCEVCGASKHTPCQACHGHGWLHELGPGNPYNVHHVGRCPALKYQDDNEQ